MTVDAQAFKSAMAQWASGVTVLTTYHQDEMGRPRWIGITASSFSSLSLEPPRILVCVARRLYTHRILEQSQVFAVNILHTGQLEWGMRFAGMLPEEEDRFVGIDVQTAQTGAPILSDVLGWLDCRVAHAYDGGDHTIFVGDVLAADGEEGSAPLMYYNRQWRTLGPDALTL